MGGDEFALVLPGFQIEHLSKTLSALERVAVESGLAVCGERLIDISVGAAFYPENGSDTEGLLAEAERRMYLAKRRLKIAAPSDSSGLANLAAQIDDSAVCAPHSALLQ
jgi:GGDEF domain-containing protein